MRLPARSARSDPSVSLCRSRIRLQPSRRQRTAEPREPLRHAHALRLRTERLMSRTADRSSLAAVRDSAVKADLSATAEADAAERIATAENSAENAIIVNRAKVAKIVNSVKTVTIANPAKTESPVKIVTAVKPVRGENPVIITTTVNSANAETAAGADAADADAEVRERRIRPEVREALIRPAVRQAARATINKT